MISEGTLRSAIDDALASAHETGSWDFQRSLNSRAKVAVAAGADPGRSLTSAGGAVYFDRASEVLAAVRLKVITEDEARPLLGFPARRKGLRGLFRRR